MTLAHQIDHRVEVNGLIFTIIQPENLQEAEDFYYDVFLKDEPAVISFGGYSTRDPSMLKHFREVVMDGVSLMAIDPKANNRMVGFRTGTTFSRGSPNAKAPSFEDAQKQGFPDSYCHIMNLFSKLMSPDDIFKANPDVNKIYEMVCLSSLPEYRGRGIATELVRQAIQVAKKAGCDAVTVLSTNDLTRRIFRKIGMTTMKTTPWEKCSVKDQNIFKDVKSEGVSSHFLKL